MRSTKCRSHDFPPIFSLNLRFSAGFTLFEILIVSLMLGILTMLSWPQLSSALAQARLSGAAEEIVNALEFAQQKALSSGIETRVIIDDSADNIEVEKFTPTHDLLGSETELNESQVENAIFKTIDHPLKKGTNYTIVFADESRFKAVDIVTATFGAGNSVTYNPMGAPSSGGTVTLAYGNRQVFVSVDALTGKISVSE
jgi:type II secretory pathway pseudopilin PulG